MILADPNALQRFLSAVEDQQPVSGLTHNFYRYPARFSPLFARAAIEAFSKPGDVILDPFMGGGTTLVEARALGRHAIGADISSLAVFLSRVKTAPLPEADLRRVVRWVRSLPPYLNLHRPPEPAIRWRKAGYQRHVPWPIRKTIELTLARVGELPRKRQQRFARCLLLRVGQWALDCRERIPSASEFREQLIFHLDGFVEGMRQFRRAVNRHAPPRFAIARSRCLRMRAAELASESCVGSTLKPTLVVTSPPYPGVHVLYHRWNIRGRKETPAPFWIANSLDGQGGAHYTFGDRRHRNLCGYFRGIADSFRGIRQVINPEAIVIQMVAFAEPQWQIPRFLEAMSEAGFEEVPPSSLGVPAKERLWRSVPGRRWFALLKANLATSQEVVLFHKARIHTVRPM